MDSIIVNPNNAHQVYAGTDWGVYYTDDITRCLSNMAALRERYSARDGVGHANRPWFHDALSLDAQSRRLCLSFAGRRRYSHSNTYRDTNGNSHCDGNSDKQQRLPQQQHLVRGLLPHRGHGPRHRRGRKHTIEQQSVIVAERAPVHARCLAPQVSAAMVVFPINGSAMNHLLRAVGCRWKCRCQAFTAKHEKLLICFWAST